ncbi:MAG: hypothetical protein M1498_04940 [Candidatus Thermoplasmatota archaeon]|nr:hypothetical protein [Candidatus Thermoplasmatota archaeon]
MNADVQMVMYFKEKAKNLMRNNKTTSSSDLSDTKDLTIELQKDPEFNDVIKEFVQKTRHDNLIDSNESAVIEIVKAEGMKKFQDSDIEEIYLPLKKTLESNLLKYFSSDDDKSKIRLMSIWLSAVVTVVAIDTVKNKDKSIAVKRKLNAISQE